MTDTPTARRTRPAGHWTTASDEVRLDYDQRFLRRKRLETVSGAGFLVDLGETVSLSGGDAFELEDGRIIAIIAAEEPLYEIHGDLTRLAWHIGNRHTPCQIERGRLIIRRDPVLARMIAGLGGHVHEVTGPFAPEGGAYGTGRTMGHEHGGHDHGDHDHAGHSHGHVHHHGSHAPDDTPETPDAP